MLRTKIFRVTTVIQAILTECSLSSPNRLLRFNGRTRRNLAVAVLFEARGLLHTESLGVLTNHSVSERHFFVLLLPVNAVW